MQMIFNILWILNINKTKSDRLSLAKTKKTHDFVMIMLCICVYFNLNFDLLYCLLIIF